MASTHTSLYDHLVFSTKHREPWFAPDVRPRVHRYLGGVIRGIEAVAHAVGGVGDHVHVSTGLKAKHRLSDVVREMKSESSKWVKDELGLVGFAWQEGYGAFSFGAGDLENVNAYVLAQEEHQRQISFQDEYVAMLTRGLVEYDEEYFW
ncbi:MAG: transposase [Verrucomicrobiota bacterium]